MTKSKTKVSKKKTTKSSKPKIEVQKLKSPKLDKESNQAIKLLQQLTTMEMAQMAGPAIRDLGIYDIEAWAGGFNELYRAIFDALFDSNRNLHEHLIPVVKELREQSVCRADRQMLASTIARVGAVYAFTTIAMDRNLIK